MLSVGGDMFRSFGSIRILLVEADEGSKRLGSITDSKFFISVSLTEDDDKETLSRFSSACYMFTQTPSPCCINEEFLFNRVSSIHDLVITLTVLSSCDRSCCQRTVIPVSRLEEDVEISQWYQLYSTCQCASQTDSQTKVRVRVRVRVRVGSFDNHSPDTNSNPNPNSNPNHYPDPNSNSLNLSLFNPINFISLIIGVRERCQRTKKSKRYRYL
jgi:hypothetical protein